MCAVIARNVVSAGAIIAPWLQWGRRGFCAVLDQGLFACANFALNVALARWLTPQAYGSFTIAYSVFLLLTILHAEIVTSPMLTFGAGKYARGFRTYLGFLICGHTLLTVAVAVVLAGVGCVAWLRGAPSLGQAFFGFALVTPFVTLLWFARSAFYVRLEPGHAAAGGALYVVLLGGGLFALYHAHRLTVLTALGSLGLASLFVSIPLIALLRPALDLNAMRSIFRRNTTVLREPSGWEQTAGGGKTEGTAVTPAMLAHDHLRYAKWSLATYGANWVGSNAHYLVLSSTAGLAAVATMRVLDTMLLPFYNYFTAISKLLVAVFGARAGRLGIPASLVTGVAIGWGIQGALAYLGIRLYAEKILALLYGSTYTRYDHVLTWYALTLIPEAINGMLLSLCRAMARTDLTFVIQAVFAMAVVPAYIAAAQHGVQGITLSRVALSYAVLPLPFLLLKWTRNRTDRAEPGAMRRAVGVP